MFKNFRIVSDWWTDNDAKRCTSNQSDGKVKLRYSTSVLKQVHFLPSSRKTGPYNISPNKIYDHQDFGQDFKNVPPTIRVSRYADEEETCKEVVTLNYEKDIRPHLREFRFIHSLSLVYDLVDGRI